MHTVIAVLVCNHPTIVAIYNLNVACINWEDKEEVLTTINTTLELWITACSLNAKCSVVMLSRSSPWNSTQLLMNRTKRVYFRISSNQIDKVIRRKNHISAMLLIDTTLWNGSNYCHLEHPSAIWVSSVSFCMSKHVACMDHLNPKTHYSNYFDIILVSWLHLCCYRSKWWAWDCCNDFGFWALYTRGLKR